MPGMYNWLYEYISIRYCVAYAGSVLPGKYFLLWCQVCGCMHTGKYYYFVVRYVGYAYRQVLLFTLVSGMWVYAYRVSAARYNGALVSGPGMKTKAGHKLLHLLQQ